MTDPAVEAADEPQQRTGDEVRRAIEARMQAGIGADDLMEGYVEQESTDLELEIDMARSWSDSLDWADSTFAASVESWPAS